MTNGHSLNIQMAMKARPPLDEIDVELFSMVLCFSRAIEFLHPKISEHHLRVAYVASCLAEELDLGQEEIQDALIAGALHDVVAVSSAMHFDLFDDALTRSHSSGRWFPENLHQHGWEGYLLLRDFAPFAKAALAIRFHHVNWDFGHGSEFDGQPVPLISHILRLADRISVMPENEHNVLAQASGIRLAIAAETGRCFMPMVVAAFDGISEKESFWLDLTSPHKEEIVRCRFGNSKLSLGLDGLYQLARVFGKMIDYRSPFTATHSSGVAATSEELAARLGMSPNETTLIGVAGNLHDIGKLAVSTEILNKPGPLTPAEMFIIRQHPYYTHRILSMVPGLETVNTWAALHHERLDGKGYPFRSRELTLGSRIVAVADVFTAITENRPYRSGMARAQCLAVLDELVTDGAINGDVVAALRGDFEQIHHIRCQSQQAHVHTCSVSVSASPGA
ncbi:3'3'-cGAMP-specific phosphodiesterase 1 [Rhodoferax lithotrophicus]|uniref:3'3'-cGAMP-specific phosphodiesterase 1 n=2 Tax=Rhodoferax lithotrophicus TaxID=2798804 RepID=A0ABM7MN88_9BURK|nr:3'3'-cGAMP-specific phosphodiesterase 1 [Rhodoferax sp. MIZ03]